MKLSVVIPVYKAENCLRELHTRMAATFDRMADPAGFELVLVEDCGGDRSWQIIREIAAEDSRVLALVPRAATYDEAVAREFAVHLWNPLEEAVRTRLRAAVAERRGETWHCSGPVSGRVSGSQPLTEPLTVPPREVVRVAFRRS